MRKDSLSKQSHLELLDSIHVMSLKPESGRFFLHFREIFEKCKVYIGKFLIYFREILILFFLFEKVVYEEF